MRAVLRQVPADEEVLLVEGRAELEDVALLAVRGDNFRKVVVTGDPYEEQVKPPVRPYSASIGESLTQTL